MEPVTIIAPQKRVISSRQTQILQNLMDIKQEQLIYIPAALMEDIPADTSASVYFELEAYPFFQKFKEIIEEQSEPKGVLRYRRICKKDTNEARLVEDLYVMVSLFGEPEDIFVKRTNQHNIPYHVIVTLSWSNGTMAHVEYTVSDKEQIELEWSGKQQILEFHSEEMNSLISSEKYPSSLVMTADNIIKSAHSMNDDFLSRLQKCQKWIQGGVPQ